MKLTRYWFEFALRNHKTAAPVHMGCGVTAYGHDDAIIIIKEMLFKDDKIPVITTCIENIDIRTLDQVHVVPNMLAPNIRGVWFPVGYNFI